MDFLWILVAFLCGFGVKQLGMPPLVGYLAAGFGLHAAGVEPAESLETLANMGITLMLFTIGLKINVKALIKPEVWASSALHTGLWVGLLIAIISMAGWLGLSHYFDVPLHT